MAAFFGFCRMVYSHLRLDKRRGRAIRLRLFWQVGRCKIRYLIQSFQQYFCHIKGLIQQTRLHIRVGRIIVRELITYFPENQPLLCRPLQSPGS